MSILLRLLLLALAGVALVGARHASQRSGPPPTALRATSGQSGLAIPVASRQ